MRIAVVAATVFFAAFPTYATSAGRPLDCSDIVFLEPGFACRTYAVIVPGQPPVNLATTHGAADNLGNHYRVVNPGSGTAVVGQCAGLDLHRWELWISRGPTTPVTFAYIAERCADEATGAIDTVANNPQNGMHFDEEGGRLLMELQASCTGSCPAGSFYSHGMIIAIDGFATEFEILQSYTPSSGPISFRVPYMPEGFPAVDYFDTYYGDLATVGDWSQAHPLQCGYPASPPSIGDYLTVADPLPDPAPGQGRYYVTAVSYAGQRRYGRKSMGGVLSGRDPGVLPECVDALRVATKE